MGGGRRLWRSCLWRRLRSWGGWIRGFGRSWLRRCLGFIMGLRPRWLWICRKLRKIVTVWQIRVDVGSHHPEYFSYLPYIYLATLLYCLFLFLFLFLLLSLLITKSYIHKYSKNINSYTFTIINHERLNRFKTNHKSNRHGPIIIRQGNIICWTSIQISGKRSTPIKNNCKIFENING